MILVTGAAGFLGSHLMAELGSCHIPAVGVDREQGDLRYPHELDDILNRVDPDVLIHFAAKVGRLFGEDDVAETIADNAGMTATVAKACGERGIRMVYASTSEVYGDRGESIAYEGDLGLRMPHNAYGLSKRWGEEACRLYAPAELTIWRISMPYGPGLPPGRGRAAIVNMLHQAEHRQPIPVHRGAERSWCWVGDTVRAMRLTLAEPGGIWNIGRDDAAVPMKRVAEIACALTGAPLSLIEEVEAPGRQTVVKRLSTELIRGLGWKPEVTLEEGMSRTLDWLRAEAVAA